MHAFLIFTFGYSDNWTHHYLCIKWKLLRHCWLGNAPSHIIIEHLFCHFLHAPQTFYIILCFFLKYVLQIFIFPIFQYKFSGSEIEWNRMKMAALEDSFFLLIPKWGELFVAILSTKINLSYSTTWDVNKVWNSDTTYQSPRKRNPIKFTLSLALSTIKIIKFVFMTGCFFK